MKNTTVNYSIKHTHTNGSDIIEEHRLVAVADPTSGIGFSVIHESRTKNSDGELVWATSHVPTRLDSIFGKLVLPHHRRQHDNVLDADPATASTLSRRLRSADVAGSAHVTDPSAGSTIRPRPARPG